MNTVRPGILAVALLALVLAGCSARIGGSKGLDEVADDLRAENSELREKLRLAEADRAELRVKLADRAGTPQAAEIADATPRLAGIEIDSLSGQDRAGGWSIYVTPFDGRRRFLQPVGTLEVRVKSADGHTLATRTLSPLELREAYRSSFTGTHYEIELAPAAAGDVTPPGSDAKNQTLEAVLTEPGGQRFEATRTIEPRETGTETAQTASKPR